MNNPGYAGGIHPDCTVEIIPERKGDKRTIPISELKPGQFLAASFDRFYWAVDEVLQFRRPLTAFRIRLEGGTEVILTEHTWVCGQYGPTLLETAITDPFCFVDMSFRDEHVSRRRFMAELKNADGATKSLKTLYDVKHAKWHPNTKTYYYIRGLLQLLAKTKKASPKTRIVWGCEVNHPYRSGTYSLRTARPKILSPFFPVVPLTELTKNDQTYKLAFLAYHYAGHDGDLTYGKVESIAKFQSDGPWLLPVFDRHNVIAEDAGFWGDYVKQRFIFPVNQVPVFYPNEWFDGELAELTLPADGQPVFPEMVPEPVEYSLSQIYSNLLETLPHAEVEESKKNQMIEALWSALNPDYS